MSATNPSGTRTLLEVRRVNDHVAIYPVGGTERVADIYAPMDKPERLMPAMRWGELLASAPTLLAERNALESRAVKAERERDALAAALREREQTCAYIESRLSTVAAPSGFPDVSRAFCDIRGVLKHTTESARTALAGLGVTE